MEPFLTEELLLKCDRNLEKLWTIMFEKCPNYRPTLDDIFAMGFKDHYLIRKAIQTDPIPGTTKLGNVFRVVQTHVKLLEYESSDEN